MLGDEVNFLWGVCTLLPRPKLTWSFYVLFDISVPEKDFIPPGSAEVLTQSSPETLNRFLYRPYITVEVSVSGN